MNKELIDKILAAAVRAPSGDNVQPWSIKVSENFSRMDLYNLPEKDDSYYNFEQAASYIAHGALLENILTNATPQPDPLYNSIFNRRTNRFPFRHVQVAEQSMEKLKESVKNIDKVSLSLINQKDKINALAKILMVNDRLVFERKDLHGFLFDKIRWNQKQVKETKDGMPVGTLGLNPMEKLFFPFMRFWGFVKSGNYFGLSRIIGLKCWWNCRNASVLGMISTDENDKFAFVQGGRAVQRLWLEATNQGLELQPIIGLTLLIHRLEQNELDGFGNTHLRWVENSATMLPKEFEIEENKTLIMGFRLGMGKRPIQRTERRKIDW